MGLLDKIGAPFSAMFRGILSVTEMMSAGGAALQRALSTQPVPSLGKVLKSTLPKLEAIKVHYQTTQQQIQSAQQDYELCQQAISLHHSLVARKHELQQALEGLAQARIKKADLEREFNESPTHAPVTGSLQELHAEASKTEEALQSERRLLAELESQYDALKVAIPKQKAKLMYVEDTRSKGWRGLLQSSVQGVKSISSAAIGYWRRPTEVPISPVEVLNNNRKQLQVLIAQATDVGQKIDQQKQAIARLQQLKQKTSLEIRRAESAYTNRRWHQDSQIRQETAMIDSFEYHKSQAVTRVEHLEQEWVAMSQRLQAANLPSNETELQQVATERQATIKTAVHESLKYKAQMQSCLPAIQKAFERSRHQIESAVPAVVERDYQALLNFTRDLVVPAVQISIQDYQASEIIERYQELLRLDEIMNLLVKDVQRYAREYAVYERHLIKMEKYNELVIGTVLPQLSLSPELRLRYDSMADSMHEINNYIKDSQKQVAEAKLNLLKAANLDALDKFINKRRKKNTVYDVFDKVRMAVSNFFGRIGHLLETGYRKLMNVPTQPFVPELTKKERELIVMQDLKTILQHHSPDNNLAGEFEAKLNQVTGYFKQHYSHRQARFIRKLGQISMRTLPASVYKHEPMQMQIDITPEDTVMSKKVTAEGFLNEVIARGSKSKQPPTGSTLRRP